MFANDYKDMEADKEKKAFSNFFKLTAKIYFEPEYVELYWNEMDDYQKERWLYYDFIQPRTKHQAYTVRPGTADDFNFVKKLWQAHVDVLGIPFHDSIKQKLTTPDHSAVIDKVGFCFFHEAKKEGAIKIDDLCVDPAARGTGAARKLIRSLKKYKLPLILEAVQGADNNTFYEKMGFEKYGERQVGKSKMTLNLYRKEWEDELEIDYEIINKISPIEKHEGILVKRNDLLEVGEVNGLKVMGCLYLIQKALKAGKKGFITLGSRTSPQCNILSFLCSVLEVPCHLFMADSKDNSEIQDKIERRDYSEIHRVKCGYNNVLKANAQKYAQEHPELEFLPFGLESDDVMLLLANQVRNIPSIVKHITIPVGGANNISALLWGLYKAGRTDISVTGVITGADASSIEYLEKHLPPEHGKYEIVKYRPDLNASERYLAEQPAKIGDIQLHPTYEGKCRNFIKWEYGDTELLWIVGGPQK